MSTPSLTLLAINAGSSSIKFSLYSYPALAPLARGAVSDIGGAASCFTVHDGTNAPDKRSFAIPERITAVQVITDWLVEHVDAATLHCIVHRVVHGGASLRATQEVSDAVLTTLYQGRRDDPEHLPQEIHLVETLRHRFPLARHVLCFDSSFHSSMPDVASRLAVPRRYHDAGIMRLGFHGISCQYLVHQLRLLDAQEGTARADGKLVLAHLGGGASITAVEHGRSCDTSMGLSPTGGIAMSTRSGDIDPGFAWHCLHNEQMSPRALQQMLTHESGLAGIAGGSGDMAQLLARAATDSHAAQAISLFCYQAGKAVAAMAGAIDGIDVLVFAGGIGEQAAAIRQGICARLTHLGVRLDAARNDADAAIISADDSAVIVRIIATDEQWMLAENARVLLTAALPAQGQP